MNCLLAIACLLAPDNLYVTGQLFAPITHQYREGAWCRNHWCEGPMADLRIGMRAPLTSAMELDFGIRHVSFVSESDRGHESAYVSVTWRPWR